MKKILLVLLLCSGSVSAKIISKSPVPFDLTDIECMALNMYFEARAEQSVKNISAVGHVTMWRKKSKYWPNTICKVVYQQRLNDHNKWIPMYSWTKDGKSDIPRQFKSYDKCLKIAIMVLTGVLKDNTGGATHYHNTSVNPYWASSMIKTAYHGHHIFYK